MPVNTKDAIYTRARDCLKIQQTAIGFGPKNRIQYKPTNHPATFHFTTAQTLAKNLQGRYGSCISLAVEEVLTPLKLDEDLCRNPAEYRWAVQHLVSEACCFDALPFLGFENTAS